MRALWQDLTYSARILLKKPALTFVTVLTLALAIGANSAIFGVVNAILLRPLPFKDQERLVVLWHSYPQLSLLKSPVSPPSFVSYKEQGQPFDAVAAMAYRGLNLTGQDEPEQIQGMFVSADFFPALGVRPLIGRTFTPEEDQPGRNRVVILGQSFWQRRFGADRGILDKPITLNGIDFTVVGVMPSDFQLFGKADFWSPIALAPAQVGPNQFGNEYLTVVARLKPGVSFPQAQAAMNNLSSQMRQQYPQFYPESSGWHVTLAPLREELVGNFRPTLLLLLGAVGLVLLIACANVANLLLAQFAARHKEFATRVALGASRRRIVRQLLTESALLSLLGGAAGLLLALWGSGAIVANLPPDVTKSLPSWEAIGVDARMLVFTLAVTLLTGALFGVVPALTVSKLGTSAVLNETGRGARETASGSRLLRWLVVVEVGLAFVLLIASGLLIRSFIRIQGVDLGFRTDNLLTMQISLPRSKYPENQVAAFYQRLLHEVESRPGVESAAAISDLPLRPSEHGALFIVEGRQPAPGEMAPQAAYRIISPQYFKTMGAALNRGRPFTDQDSEQSPPVVIIDENTARRFWPGEEAVGKRLALTFEKKENVPRWREVVGVVAHIKEVVAEDKGEMQLYVPQLQTPMRSMFLVVRGPAGGGSLMTTTRDALRTVDRDVPAYMAMPMDQVLADSVAPRRFSMLLIGILGAVALTLAIVGLYGVLSYSVTQRTREMGIRMALGAQRSHVIRLVVKQGMGLTLIGILVGLGASLALTRVMSSQLFGVSPTDVTTFVSITLALATAAFLASYLPARRATKVDPVVSLRFE